VLALSRLSFAKTKEFDCDICIAGTRTGRVAAAMSGAGAWHERCDDGRDKTGSAASSRRRRYPPMSILTSSPSAALRSMASELAAEIRRCPAVIGEDRIFPPKGGPESKRQRLEGSFEDLLKRAKIQDFWLHDLRHTFTSWYMINGGDLYELAKILGHANIKMTETLCQPGDALTSPRPAAPPR
jgi:integrase